MTDVRDLLIRGSEEGDRPLSTAAGEREDRAGAPALPEPDRARGTASRPAPGWVAEQGGGVTSPDGEDGFAGFDVVLKRRGRSRWKWAVCTAAGEVVMSGSESSRAGARYKAERALFLLLCASAFVNDGKKPEEAAELAGYHPSRFIRQCDCQRSRLRSRNRYSLTLQS